MSEDRQAKAPEEISDAALEEIVGAFNPQPDPPGKYKPVSVNPVIQPINVNVASRPGG